MIFTHSERRDGTHRKGKGGRRSWKPQTERSQEQRSYQDENQPYIFQPSQSEV